MSVVMAMFPPSAHSNIVRNFNLVEFALTKFGITDPYVRLVAYATIRAETAKFAPVTEGESKFNTFRRPIELTPYGEETKYNLYEGRNKTSSILGHKVSGLGNDQFGDGKKYMGRGFVQLTGKANYLKYGYLIGVGSKLAETPELANDPSIAAQILAAYMREKVAVISNALRQGDFRSARRAVNGGLNGMEEFATAYTIGVNLMRTDARDLPNSRNIA